MPGLVGGSPMKDRWKSSGSPSSAWKSVPVVDRTRTVRASLSRGKARRARSARVAEGGQAASVRRLSGIPQMSARRDPRARHSCRVSREAVRIEPRHGRQVNHQIRGKERVDREWWQIGECRPARAHAEQHHVAGMTRCRRCVGECLSQAGSGGAVGQDEELLVGSEIAGAEGVDCGVCQTRIGSRRIRQSNPASDIRCTPARS